MNQDSMSFILSHSLLKFMPIESVMLSDQLILFCTLHLCLQSFSALGYFPMNWLFASASASATVLPMSTPSWFPLGMTDWSLFGIRDYQAFSPEAQFERFESICSLLLSLHYGPTLTSVHYCRNHSFDYKDSPVQSLSHVHPLRPYGLQDTRLPCPSPTLRTCSKIMSELVMPSNHLVLCRPLLLLPPILPSIRLISNESVLCIRWPKYWSFSFSISPSYEYSGLISFRSNFFDLLTAQGILKNLLQQHSSKAPILHCSTFFMVQLSHPYITNGKTKALTIWAFVYDFSDF